MGFKLNKILFLFLLLCSLCFVSDSGQCSVPQISLIDENGRMAAASMVSAIKDKHLQEAFLSDPKQFYHQWNVFYKEDRRNTDNIKAP